MLAHRVSCGQDCRLVSLNLIALGFGRPPYRLANVSRSPACCRGTTDIDPTLSYWTVQNSWGPVSARSMSKIDLDLQISASKSELKSTWCDGRRRHGAKTDISRWCGTLQTNSTSPIPLAGLAKVWWRGFLTCPSQPVHTELVAQWIESALPFEWECLKLHFSVV